MTLRSFHLLLYFIAAVLACTLPACTTSPTPTLAEIAPQNETITPVFPVDPGSTPLNTQAAAKAVSRENPSATPKAILPTSVPEDLLSPLIVLENFTGSWSPVRNQMGGILWTAEATGQLALADAPGFALHTLLSDQLTYKTSIFGYEVVWKPDGEWLLFAGPLDLGPVDEVSTPWAVMPSGKNPHPIMKNQPSGRWMRIPGWVDAQTMIETEYEGGGTHSTRLVQFGNGEIIAAANIKGSVYPGRSYGAPFEEDNLCGAGIALLTSQRQPETSLLFGTDHIRWMPGERNDCQNAWSGMHFVNWHPVEDRLIAVAETIENANKQKLISTQLLEWDLETDIVTQLAPTGVDAQYSGDGRWLALITLGKAELNPDGTIKITDPQPILEGAQTVLQLVDTASKVSRISLPVFSSYNTTEFSIPVYVSKVAFSPNNRYLAVVTPGEIVLSNTGHPIGVKPGDRFFLNILDLAEMKVKASIQVTEKSSLLWSPQGDRLLYQSSQTGYAILSLPTGQNISLALNDDIQVRGHEWSFDGEYLGLVSTKAGEVDAASFDTMIFKTR